MIKHIQFEDEKELTIVSEFCGPQDPAVHDHLGEVEDTDPRYLAFLAKIITL